MGEIVYIRDFIRARRRARQRCEMLAAIAVIEASLEFARFSYVLAPLGERLARAGKIRQLEEVVVYARGRV